MKRVNSYPHGLQSILLAMEGISSNVQSFFREALNLKSLGQSAISNLTNKHLDLRLHDPEANDHLAVLDAKWKVPKNELVVYFQAAPTYDNDVAISLAGRPYRQHSYKVVFQFLGVEAYLGTIDSFIKLNKNGREKAIENMFWNCSVKVYSNDPSFYYQGVWEDMEKVDGTIFKFPGPPGDGIWHNRHAASGGLSNSNIRITKHMAAVLVEARAFIPVIAKTLKRVD